MAIPLDPEIQEVIRELSRDIHNTPYTPTGLFNKLAEFASYSINLAQEKYHAGPNAERPMPIELKTVGQLIDELGILNIRIWMLIDKVKVGIATPEEAQKVQEYNDKRNQYVRAIDRRLGDRDIGAKLYGS